ncbi:MAG: ferrous iron transport protein B [Gammaproteobacteria bacterium]|nr:ferrous iron transport protein B [Gammaproteobacteria bacterium]MDH4314812.1 ferrous iron transport protein B [Gammaproteobacteria bacterium]MDH5213087.1 ferrous iron transport protein B [Gammaproteobacteria bacterium]
MDKIGVRRHPSATVVVVGNPNSGKSTLFNRLTGMRQKTANYPGVTVEKHIGVFKLGDTVLELVDLPGMFALSTHSLEERIAVDVLFGRMPDVKPPAGILAVLDTTNLYQGLYLLQQLLTLNLPVVVALTMTDAAQASGLHIDVDALKKRLGGVQICPVVATTGQGIDALRRALSELPSAPKPDLPTLWQELSHASEELVREMPVTVPRIEIERALIDHDSDFYRELVGRLGDGGAARVDAIRQALFGADPPLAKEARQRYGWVRDVLSEVQQSAPAIVTWSSRLSAWINRPIPGTIGLFVVMAVVFQAVFAWATPLMDAIDVATSTLGASIASILPAGAIASFVSDGVIAGVGSVIVFLPQILILFLFIIILEDSGYLARAAYLMDRVMRSVGLSGQSIIPMISSFACAVPGIMATRVIPNRRDRIATILAAPFMTCSARLPVYALLIAAFVPAQKIGWMNLQGLVLFGLYLLGIVAGLLTALMLRQSVLRGPKPPFALMLPEFRRPNPRTVLMQLLGRAMIFMRRAGTVIFSVAVVVWALAYFPRSPEIESQLQDQIGAAQQRFDGEYLQRETATLKNQAAAAQLEQSFLGRAGKSIEPLFRPLGWDWRVSAAVIAGFPAREVVVAVLGTVYAVGDEADEATLAGRLRSASWPDGSAVFTLPMVIGLLIFYACCLQCAATLAVIRRETNGWRWPVFAWLYMTSIGYLGALIAFQLGNP